MEDSLMRGPTGEPTGAGTSKAPESYLGVLASLSSVLAALGLLSIFGLRSPERNASPPPSPVVSKPADEPAKAKEPPRPVAVPTVIEPDPEAIASAEHALDVASRDRARADDRAASAAERLKRAQVELAGAIRNAKTITSKLRDPSARIARARANGEVLRAQRDKLQGELTALANAPRPRSKPLIDKSPVARPPDGDEFHFEVHRDRVAFIDLDRLMDRVKTDARVQMRMADDGRPIHGKVGPEGEFSIVYEMAPDSFGRTVDELLGSRALAVSYTLTGWEIVPERELRGETFAMALQPAADFARAINRLDPSRDTVTMWVYPDGFELYRKLRDVLHERGFLVAARPLPSAMAIRGSPGGSVSAGQ